MFSRTFVVVVAVRCSLLHWLHSLHARECAKSKQACVLFDFNLHDTNKVAARTRLLLLRTRHNLLVENVPPPSLVPHTPLRPSSLLLPLKTHTNTRFNNNNFLWTRFSLVALLVFPRNENLKKKCQECDRKGRKIEIEKRTAQNMFETENANVYENGAANE